MSVIGIFTALSLVFRVLITPLVTYCIMIGWGSAYNNAIISSAPGFMELFWPVFWISLAISLVVPVALSSDIRSK